MRWLSHLPLEVGEVHMLAVTIDHEIVSGRREVLVAFQEGDSLVQNAWRAMRLRRRRWLQRVIEVEEVPAANSMECQR